MGLFDANGRRFRVGQHVRWEDQKQFGNEVGTIIEYEGKLRVMMDAMYYATSQFVIIGCGVTLK